MHNQLQNALVDARRKNNLMPAQVAEKAHIDPNDYSRIENGDVYPEFIVLSKIAKVLDIDLEKINVKK